MTNLLTIPQVAVTLKLTRVRVWQLIKAGRLPAERYGRDYIIKEQDLKKFQPHGRPKKK
jgi:excisionase family DNA binding protein